MNKNWQVKYEADRLIQHAGLNCRYYQYMSYWWYIVDRLLKFILAVGAVLGLVVDEGPTKWLSVFLIALSIALNVVPSDASCRDRHFINDAWLPARRFWRLFRRSQPCSRSPAFRGRGHEEVLRLPEQSFAEISPMC